MEGGKGQILSESNGNVWKEDSTPNSLLGVQRNQKQPEVIDRDYTVSFFAIIDFRESGGSKTIGEGIQR